jgi:hypothetical protein
MPTVFNPINNCRIVYAHLLGSKGRIDQNQCSAGTKLRKVVQSLTRRIICTGSFDLRSFYMGVYIRRVIARFQGERTLHFLFRLFEW